MVAVVGVAVDDLDAHLFGQGELDLLAAGLADDGSALLDGHGRVGHLGLGYALLLGDHFAVEAGKGDWLVHAGLDGLGVADADGHVEGADDGDVVGGLLGNLLAVLVTIGVVAVSVTGLADGDHLHVGLSLEGDLHGPGSGVLVLLFVVVTAHLVVNGLRRFRAHGAGHVVAVLALDDNLNGQIHVLADSGQGRRAHVSVLGHVLHGAVVLGVLVPVGGLVISRSRSIVSIGGSGMRLVRGLSGLVGGLSGLVDRLGGGLGDGFGSLGGGSSVGCRCGCVAVAVVIAVGAAVLGEGGVGAGAGHGGHQGQEECGKANEGLTEEQQKKGMGNASYDRGLRRLRTSERCLIYLHIGQGLKDY